LTPSERVKAQRAELLSSVRQLVQAGVTLSVSSIAAERGLGRNTFYEHFQTIEGAVAACVEEARNRLSEALGRGLEVTQVGTPSEHARGLVRALVEFREKNPDRWLVLERHGNEQLVATLSDAVERLHDVYAAAGASKAVLPPVLRCGATWALLGIIDASMRDVQRADIVDDGAELLGRLLR